MKTAGYMIRDFGKSEKEKVSSKVRGETFSLQEEVWWKRVRELSSKTSKWDKAID